MSGEAYKRLKDLGEERFEAVKDRLRRGDTPKKVAQTIQEEWQDCLDIKLESLAKTLDRFRRDVVRPEVVNGIVEAAVGKSTSGLRKRLDAMQEMENLAIIQRGRFEAALGREQMSPKGMLLKMVSEEGRLLKDILVELGKLQLETGVLRRAPKTINGTVTDQDGQTHAFSWTEEAERLMETLDGIEYTVLQQQ